MPNSDESRSETLRPRIESLSEIRTYVAIVEAGSLAGAGRALGISPNAVSRRLTALENRLERRLIMRTTRRLTVTDEGRRFCEQCRTALSALARAELDLAGDDGLRGTVRIGVHADIICSDLARALGQLLEDAPEVNVEVRVDSEFIDPIAAGLDVSVYVGRPPSSSLKRVSLGKLEWGLAAAPEYVERRGRPRSPNQLVRHECLRLRRDGPETTWKLRRRNGTVRRFPVGGRLETTDGRMLTAALYAGLGIGVRLRLEIDSASARGQLVPILPQWLWGNTPVYALIPEGRHRLPAVRAVVDALAKTIRTLS